MQTTPSGALRVRVHVRPGAGRDRVGPVDTWRGALKVEVKAPPEEGAANREVERVVALAIGVPPARVRIEHGATSRDKVIMVEGTTEEAVRAAVGALPS